MSRSTSAGLAEMAREFQDAGDPRMKLALEDPDAFFAHVERFEAGRDLPPDRVRQTWFWLLRGDRLIGASRLRHRLIPFLERDGGHIAYEIRPSERRKGFGTELLRLTLREAAAVGIRRALLTTEPTNRGSIQVISNNGGRFEDTSVSPESGKRLHRYWIDVPPIVRCLLWDFGDTLCDELSLWRASPEWLEVYRSFDEPDGIGAAWSLGELDARGVAARLAERMTLSEAEIHAHLTRTDVFEFFPFTYAFFRARHLPQAVVTVNPAEFRALAEALAFDEVADPIVISGEEKTIDKSALCEIALERMSIQCPHAGALLIDNKPANVDAWTRRGGIGYRYTTDSAFRKDVEPGIAGLVEAGRRAP